MNLVKPEVFAGLVALYDQKSKPENVLIAIDESVNKGTVPIGKSNTEKLTAEVAPDRTPDAAAQVEVAIGTIQKLFSQSGISIALLGEDHTYKDDEPAKPSLPSELESIGDSLEELRTTDPQFFRTIEKRFREYESTHKKYLAEIAHYRKSILDMKRAQSIIALADGGQQIPKPDLTIVERKMQYDPQSNPVRETDIIKMGFSNKQRSALIAAYIFLSAAGGDQSGNDRVLVFFGAQHADILNYFEYFAKNSKNVPWLRGRKRTYGLIASHVE